MLRVDRQTRFILLPVKLLCLMIELNVISTEIGEDIVITGSQGWPYDDGEWLVKNKVTGIAHRRAAALDLRKRNLKNVETVVSELIERGYKVKEEIDHIHVQTDGKIE